MTPPYTTDLNEIPERMNHTLKELARAMLAHANMTRYLWAEAVMHAEDIRKSIPSPHKDLKTP